MWLQTGQETQWQKTEQQRLEALTRSATGTASALRKARPARRSLNHGFGKSMVEIVARSRLALVGGIKRPAFVRMWSLF